MMAHSESESIGVCTYCGQDAGMFRNHHEECLERHQAGWPKMISLAANAARTGADLEGLAPKLGDIARSSFIALDRVPEAILKGWEAAAEAAIDDRILSRDEEERLSSFAKRYALTREQLDANRAWSRIAMGATLRDLLEGNVPSRLVVSGQLPFNLQKSEALVWVFKEVKLYEERTRTVYVGGSQGLSIRLAKGIYYRPSVFAATPVSSIKSLHIDTGMMGVTTKHLYFAGPHKGFRVPYRRIVSFTPYADGLGISRETATGKPQIFLTGDGWFVYNLVRNLASRGPE